jgi:hypothetical protein
LSVLAVAYAFGSGPVGPCTYGLAEGVTYEVGLVVVVVVVVEIDLVVVVVVVVVVEDEEGDGEAPGAATGDGLAD